MTGRALVYETESRIRGQLEQCLLDPFRTDIFRLEVRSFEVRTHGRHVETSNVYDWYTG
jgi:hypothetical protein